LGASTTFCAEVSGNAAAWPHQVTEQLRRALPDKRVDYINAGVPGYVVATSHENWRRRVARHRPDIVVIYHATNDLAKDTRALARARGLVAQPKEAEMSWLARYSMLWFLVEKNLAIRAAQSRAADAEAPKLTELPPDLAEGFRQRLTSLVRDIQASGALVALPTFSYRLRREQTAQEQLQAAESALYYMPYMSPPALLAGYEAYNRAIRQVARDTGALLIEGELDIPGDARHFTDSVHFTDHGSAAMARRVAAALTAPAFLDRIKRHKGWS
ncbi:MAG: SGNH/GDSL hydrolase family protein, partial [Thiobacillaceae bacterium]|nr:SGNH/GDSL hydrolase family protein [Thiobacillaceae bacterium]